MVKKRPKSRPVRVSAAQHPRDTTAKESFEDEIYAAINSAAATAPVLMKVCRLCETKDGPFLNIFNADKVTAKRIDEVLPFTVTENDELPNKICFRCSAKVEELYEFIVKCVKTQDNLRTAMGKRSPLLTKTKNTLRIQWEKHLDKKKISNDDICNALIRNAMANIKDLTSLPLEEEKLEKPQPAAPASALINKKVRNSMEPIAKKEVLSARNNYQSDEECVTLERDEVTLKQVKLSIEKCDSKITRSSRSNANNQSEFMTVTPPTATTECKLKQYPSRSQITKMKPPEFKVNEVPKQSNTNSVNNIDKSRRKPYDNLQSVIDKSIENTYETPPKAPEAPPPPINIMDHVSTIKVNSVGTLFLCKLCNRNFLKKEVVLAHGCAKNNVPKDKYLHNMPPREPPKPPVTVKYIKMDRDFKKTIESRTAQPEKRPVVEDKLTIKKVFTPPAVNVNIPEQPDVKPKLKPKAGPASKTKQLMRQEESQVSAPPPFQPPPQPESVVPAIQFSNVLSLNSRYKLVPGPNNTYSLVEESVPHQQMPTPTPQFQMQPQLTTQYQMTSQTPQIRMTVPTPQFQMAAPTTQFQMTTPQTQFQMATQANQYQMATPANQFQMATPANQYQMATPANQYQMATPANQYQMAAPKPQFHKLPPQNTPGPKSKSKKRKLDNQPSTAQHGAIIPDEIIDLEESILPEPQVEKPYPVGLFTTPHHSGAVAQNVSKTSVTTPAMKKQSYTIVQTGNPSKLLISTKPQPVTEEQQKKKSKKKTEDNAQSKDGGFFTFINVDPLVQPSYVLPTDNIIQESQISTSTPASKAALDKEKSSYSCNMCDESFSREKKLLTHIQSHFNQMDEEDQLRREKSGPSSKKRTRKS